MNKAHSIYSTVECDAWSRDFSYEDYLDFKMKTGCKSSPLSPEGYRLFGELMYAEMIKDAFTD